MVHFMIVKEDDSTNHLCLRQEYADAIYYWSKDDAPVLFKTLTEYYSFLKNWYGGIPVMVELTIIVGEGE